MSHSQNEALGSTGNEFEIIEFTVSGQSFGVNVSKVRQIVQFDEKALTKAPNANANVLGLFLFRSVPVALVDLHKALEIEAIPNETPLVLVAEFNEEATAFLIDGVSRIHRVSWASIQPMNPILESMSASFTGSINIEDREILIVDLEQIIADIDPEKRLDARLDAHPGTKSKAGVDLAKMKIALAEDSSFMRKSMAEALKREGFSVVGLFDNGESALDFMKGCAEKAGRAGKLSDYVDILVTDIEMPKMSGLTLAKSVREMGLGSIPIVVFSSIVNKQMMEKAKAAGVSSFVSKPKLEQLRDLILNAVEARA